MSLVTAVPPNNWYHSRNSRDIAQQVMTNWAFPRRPWLLRHEDIDLIGFFTGNIANGCKVLKYRGKVTPESALRSRERSGFMVKLDKGLLQLGFSILRVGEGCWQIFPTSEAMQRRSKGVFEADIIRGQNLIAKFQDMYESLTDEQKRDPAILELNNDLATMEKQKLLSECHLAIYKSTPRTTLERIKKVSRKALPKPSTKPEKPE